MIRIFFLTLFISTSSGCTTSPTLAPNNSPSKTYTLLHFWAPWCMLCKPELAALNSISQVLDSNNIEIKNVSISDDDILSRKYKIKEVPVTILINPYGKNIQIKDPTDQKFKDRIEGPRGWDSQKGINALLESISQ